MTQQQAENATKWLHTIHFNEKESFLSNRLKKKNSPKTGYPRQFFVLFLITHKFGNYDNATDRKCRKMVTQQNLERNRTISKAFVCPKP